MKKCRNLILCALAFTFFLSAIPVFAARKQIITIGDSITWGSCSGTTLGSRDLNKTYQGYLRRCLTSEYNITNYGVSGLSVLPDPVYQSNGSTDLAYGALNNSQVKKALNSSPDIVLIMMGTNDSKRTNGSKQGVWDAATGGVENFYQSYKTLVQKFRDLPSKPEVYVMLPPPTLPADFGRNTYRIDNSILENYIVPIERNVAEELMVNVIDVREKFPQPTSTVNQRSLARYLMDAVHPNYRGYQLIAQTVAEALGINSDPIYDSSTQQPTTPSSPSTPSAPSGSQTPEQAPSVNSPSSNAPSNTNSTPITSPKTFTVTYNASDGYGDLPTDPNSYQTGDVVTTLAADDLLKDDYRFIGWSTTQNSAHPQYKVGETFPITANTTLYACWEPIPSFRIYLHGVGEESKTIGSFYSDTVVSLPTSYPSDFSDIPVGYVFGGWSAEDSTTISAENTLTVGNADIHLYPIFTELTPPATDDTPPEATTPPTPAKPSMGIVWIYIAIPVGFLIASGIAFLFIFKKRLKDKRTENK